MTSNRAWWVMVGTILSVCVLDRVRTPAWETRVHGTLDDGFGVGAAVALDPAGNVVAAGITENTGTGHDFTVIELSALTGTEIWRQVIDGTDVDTITAVSDEADEVAVDGAGDVVASGTLRNAGTKTDTAIIKLAGDTGAEIWRQVIDGRLHDYDSAPRVALDPAGDVVAVCSLANTNRAGNFTVLRLAGASGAELWRQDIHGTAEDFPGYKGSHGSAVALDPAGNVVAAGSTSDAYPDGSFTTYTYDDFAVVKLDGATGAEMWRVTIDGAQLSDNAWAVAVDGNGDVLAVGAITRAGANFYSARTFTVVKLAGADGTLLWGQMLGTLNRFGIGEAYDVRVDPAGDVIASGWIGGNFTVVKFLGSTGELLWQRKTPNGLARRITLDDNGDVLAVGFLGYRFAVQKYLNTTGRIRWRRLLPGNATNAIQGLAVVADPLGDVVASGWSAHSFTVIKACGRNGGTRNTLRCPR